MKTPSRSLLRPHLRRLHSSAVLKSSLSRHPTRLTALSRSDGALNGADLTFLAPLQYQQDFVRYRIGRFQLGKSCVCDTNVMFRRGHENCRYFPQLIHLSASERRRKSDLPRNLGVGLSTNFTNTNFLLNERQYHRVGKALSTIRKILGAAYSERMDEVH